MSTAPELRRADKLMSDAPAREVLAGAYSGRLATVGPDGSPYVVLSLARTRSGRHRDYPGR